MSRYCLKELFDYWNYKELGFDRKSLWPSLCHGANDDLTCSGVKYKHMELFLLSLAFKSQFIKSNYCSGGKSNSGDFQVCLTNITFTTYFVCNSTQHVWCMCLRVSSSWWLIHDLIQSLTNAWMCIWCIHAPDSVVVSMSMLRTLKPFGLIYFLAPKFHQAHQHRGLQSWSWP